MLKNENQFSKLFEYKMGNNQFILKCPDIKVRT